MCDSGIYKEMGIVYSRFATASLVITWVLARIFDLRAKNLPDHVFWTFISFIALSVCMRAELIIHILQSYAARVSSILDFYLILLG